MPSPPVLRKGGRVNEDILSPTVQLIDAEGVNRGNVPTAEALSLARDAGLDLIEVSPGTVPPVCKILDHGRHKYLTQKKAAEMRKKQKVIDVKEVKLRPNIDAHDYHVKLRAIRKFLEQGNKVKITLRFRGREVSHQDLGMGLLHKVRTDLADISRVELEPKLEGRQLNMIISSLPR